MDFFHGAQGQVHQTASTLPRSWAELLGKTITSALVHTEGVYLSFRRFLSDWWWRVCQVPDDVVKKKKELKRRKTELAHWSLRSLCLPRHILLQHQLPIIHWLVRESIRRCTGHLVNKSWPDLPWKPVSLYLVVAWLWVTHWCSVCAFQNTQKETWDWLGQDQMLTWPKCRPRWSHFTACDSLW